MRNNSRLLDRRGFVTAAGATAVLLSAPSLVRANTWPSKPIRILAGSAPGGQTDQYSRLYGDYLSRELGQTVVVENKAGAGGAVAAVEAKRAEPDGHTLLVTNTTAFMLNPVLMKDIRYDVAKDFAIISLMPTGSLAFAVADKVGAKTLQDFIAYARKTEKVNVGTYASGSYAHILIAELNRQYGLKMEAVHYRGEAPMWTDLAGQSIDAGFGSYAAASPLLDSGKARVVAVSRRRISTLPDVGTLQEQGATSRANALLTFQSWAAPAATPPEITARLSELLVAAWQGGRIRDTLRSQGVDEGPLAMDASRALYKDEAPIWADLASGLGLERQ